MNDYKCPDGRMAHIEHHPTGVFLASDGVLIPFADLPVLISLLCDEAGITPTDVLTVLTRPGVTA